MEPFIYGIDELTASAVDYFKNKQRLSTGTLGKYIQGWEKLKCFMNLHNLTDYSFAVGDSYIQSKLGTYSYNTLSTPQKHFLRCINALTDFQQMGSVLVKRKTADLKFEGAIGKIMTDLVNRNINVGFSQSTTKSYKRHLHRLLAYLTANNIRLLDTINISHIIAFIKSYGNDQSSIKHNMLAIIRAFFKFAYVQQLIPIDYSAKIPRDNYIQQPGLPSVYSPQEIEAMIKVIDRGNKKGKRDYALIILATRLGLRSSDIRGLKFENIIWEQCRIILNQEKTKKTIELPLTEEIGSAIIDYLKYARPFSDEPYIFLRLVSPFRKLSAMAFANIVHSYLQLACIDFSKRKHGAHVLRHSLASVLLQDKIPLPVISEVLGHKNTDSTMYYLRIDIDSLRKCALVVPSVSPTFYIRVQTYVSSK